MTGHLDLIIEGHILTMSHMQPVAEAVGIKDGSISAVGTFDEVNQQAGPDTDQWDMSGKTLLPGFIDTHMHPLLTGNVSLNVDLAEARSVGEICRMLKKRAETTREGEYVKGLNFNYDVIREGRMPTLEELDAISSGHPIAIVVFDCHSVMLNSLALKQLEIPENAEGVVVDKKGKPTGLLEDPAVLYAFHLIIPSDESEQMNIIQAVSDEALKVGITTLHTKEIQNVMNVILANEQALSVRIKPMVLVSQKTEVENIVNDPVLSKRAVVAIIGDGAQDSDTAAFFDPYLSDPSNFGMLYYADNELEELVETTHRAGMQASIHTCGTRAIEQAIRIYEKVLTAYPRGNHRHRVEHFEYPMFDQVRRTVSAGITLAIQPSFMILAGQETFDGQVKLLGKERADRWLPLRSILDLGGLIAGGSDSPVSRMSPLKGIYASVNHPNEKHRTTLYEAIRMFTVDAAKAGFDEDTKGKIEVGKLADFVVLSSDPFQTSNDQLADIRVEATIVGGKKVFSVVE
jgi:predicted amidohydrolase YtcJ